MLHNNISTKKANEINFDFMLSLNSKKKKPPKTQKCKKKKKTFKYFYKLNNDSTHPF